MKKVCVVIPIHSSNPSEIELRSFEQCFRVLNKYSVYVLTLNNLDLVKYKERIPSFESVIVPDKWLSSVHEYNKMKININFYKLFVDFEYLLTYELDAYVFNDQLQYWVEREFDYIGAPFVENNNGSFALSYVGNSGFSLRNIQTCILILSQLQKQIRISNFLNYLKLSILIKIIAYFERFYSNIFFIKCRIISAYSEGIYIHEDIFWSYFIPKLFPLFKVAEVEFALKFAFEKLPSNCFQLNNNELPFGCHGWGKYEPVFWQKFMKDN